MKIAITGIPGIGKTTLCLKVYNALRNKVKICGFITREERIGERRVGFRLIDLSTNFEAKLARVGRGRVMVGKYEVLIEEFESFLENVDLSGDLVIIDEVGPMELKSSKFVSIVQDLIKRENVLFTVHYKANHWLAERIRKEFRLYEIDEKNRDRIAEEIVKLYDP
ncbi:MAG: NTPase [Archaeoglobaceae archaeon]